MLHLLLQVALLGSPLETSVGETRRGISVVISPSRISSAEVQGQCLARAFLDHFLSEKLLKVSTTVTNRTLHLFHLKWRLLWIL